MNRFAQTAVRLFGIFWLVRGLASCGSSAVDFFRFLPVRENPDWSSYILLAGGLAAVVFVVLTVIPGIALIVYGDRLVSRLFPAAPPAPTWSASDGLVVGCALLSFYFMIVGASSLISGVVASVAAHLDERESARFLDYSPFQDLGVGATDLVLGFLLYRYAGLRADRVANDVTASR